MQKEFTLERNYDVYTTIEIVERNGKYYAQVNRNIDDLWQEDDEYECWIDSPDNLMTEENNNEEEYDAIIETFCAYVKANGVKYARICDKCGKGMNEGYFAYYEYYCDTDCLFWKYPYEEWQKLSADDNDDYYWTQWEDENEYEYVLFNNQLICIE